MIFKAINISYFSFQGIYCSRGRSNFFAHSSSISKLTALPPQTIATAVLGPGVARESWKRAARDAPQAGSTKIRCSWAKRRQAATAWASLTTEDVVTTSLSSTDGRTASAPVVLEIHHHRHRKSCSHFSSPKVEAIVSIFDKETIFPADLAAAKLAAPYIHSSMVFYYTSNDLPDLALYLF